MREHYEEGTSVRRAIPLLAVLAVVWLAMLAGDWFMRFHWFRWQDTVYFRPVTKADRPNLPAGSDFTEIEVAASRGGDLTRLIGVEQARAAFEEPRPAAVLSVDPEGFRSLPYAPGTPFDVVVVGDSYMAEGVPLTNQISARLGEALGAPVLNRAYMGRGPFQSLMLWIEQNWTRTPHPKWLVWGFVERDISGKAFSGYVYLLERHRGRVETELTQQADLKPRIFWSSLAPSALRKSWPNSSALAQVSRKAWSHLQFHIFGELPSDVFRLEPPSGQGDPLLGYGLALDAMYWPPEVRGLDQVVWAIEYIRDYLATIGVQLLVVPIPDKEQVYRDWIPLSAWHNGTPPPPSMLDELQERLDAKDIPSVALLPAFREAAGQGIPLYWRDDTHWRPEGISLAAQLIAERLQGIMEP